MEKNTKNNNSSDKLFENPFLKEYLFNLQVNQKISMKEFIFTRKVFILIGITLFLLWYNQDSSNSIRYILIGFACIFFYMFKNNRTLKKEKYFIPKDNEQNANNELFLHFFFNKKIKNNLKTKHFSIIFLLSLCFADISNAQFITNINQSTNTQEKNNEIYEDENEEMVKRAKIKNILYLSQEKKNFLTNQINDQIKIESDLEINMVKTKIEKSKNEIRK